MLPPTGERARLEAMLDAHLSGGAPVPVKHSPPAAPRAYGWRFVTSLAVGVALVGGAAFLTLRPKATQSPAPAPSAAPIGVPAPQSAIETPPDAPPVEAPALPAPEPARSAKPAPESTAPAPRADRLAQEVALLTQATSALRAGRAAAALKLLDEHQRTFPNGMLVVERRAVRAQALCSLKRVTEGRAELARLAPQSPAAGRAKQICDAASASSATSGQ